MDAWDNKNLRPGEAREWSIVYSATVFSRLAVP
jgi:hypothetical protein